MRASHTDGLISLQKDLSYFFDSMTQEIYQELFWGKKKKQPTGTLCVYINYKIIYIYILEK